MGLEGIKLKVDAVDESVSSEYGKELATALKFLDQYHNDEFKGLLEGLPGEVKLSLFNDLGGSFGDILEERYDIEKAKVAFAEYTDNVSVKGDRYEVMEEKSKKRKEAIRMLKASMIS